MEYCVAAAYVCTAVYHVSPTALLQRALRSSLTKVGCPVTTPSGVPPCSQSRGYPTRQALLWHCSHFISTQVRRLDAAATELRGVGQLCGCLWLCVVRGCSPWIAAAVCRPSAQKVCTRRTEVSSTLYKTNRGYCGLQEDEIVGVVWCKWVGSWRGRSEGRGTKEMTKSREVVEGRLGTWTSEARALVDGRGRKDAAEYLNRRGETLVEANEVVLRYTIAC
jgi:hypothetical protein